LHKEPQDTQGIASPVISDKAERTGKNIMDKQIAKLDYVANGDYYLPDIQLEQTEDRPLGKYGRMRRSYLQENNTLLYNHLILTGKLFPHLWEIQDTAASRMEQLMQELLAADPAPDKKTHQMAWVRHMNALRATAEETIEAELIYC
jgi:hypothetical protein